MNEQLTFTEIDPDTEAYIVEASRFSANELIIGGIKAACRAGRTPREF